MTLPRTLTFVRHGQSESNLAKNAFEEGKHFENEEALMEVHTSERRLTRLGIEQAQAAGSWLRENWLNGYRMQNGQQRTYVSPYIRAMETAGHFGFGDHWRPDSRLAERNWGQVDQKSYADRAKEFENELKYRKTHAFYWRPGTGETFQDVFQRMRDFQGSLHRECSEHNVLAVCHGETMWVARDVFEKMMPQDLRREFMNQTDVTNIHNCRIIQYTRERDDGQWDKHLVRMRFVNPMDPKDRQTNSDWMPIVHRQMSHEDLLAYAADYPNFIFEDA